MLYRYEFTKVITIVIIIYDCFLLNITTRTVFMTFKLNYVDIVSYDHKTGVFLLKENKMQPK